MKRLDIIIPQGKLVEVNNLLHKHKVGGMTFYDIKGRGREKQDPVRVGREVATYVPEFGYHTKIEVVVADALAQDIIDDLLKIIGKGSSALGKIFVFEVEEAFDLSTMEKGDSAL